LITGIGDVRTSAEPMRLIPEPEPEANNGAAAEWARFHLFVPPLSMMLANFRTIQDGLH